MRSLIVSTVLITVALVSNCKAEIIVLLGEGQGEKAVKLCDSPNVIVYVQSASKSDVAATRQTAFDAGLLGKQIYVEHGDWSRIGLATNLANAVHVSGSAAAANGVENEEVLRVIQPRGEFHNGGKVAKKPVPEGTGEWTHPYHGPDNNPQSEDSLAKAPYLTKFLATPWYGPMPEVTVSAGGRIFKAFGHLAFKPREWKMLSKLVALDAYNGTRLWERELAPGFMIHRNTIVATDDTLYIADNESCKLIDAATGELRGEIVVPNDVGDGPSWKWMTIRDGKLMAVIGEKEKPHPVHKGTRKVTGWPWQTVKSTYGPYQTSWGFGRTLLAFDLETKEIAWKRDEEHAIDSRATCMSDGRIFLYSHQKHLTAVDATNGDTIWRTEADDVINAIGEHDPAQNPRLGYATSSYAKCNKDAIFFAGPQRKKLVAVSAKTGKLAWTYDDGNVQLILRKDALYAMGRLTNSKKIEYDTGKILADLQCFRGNCTRATGTADSIFARGYRHSGTLRFDVAYAQPRRLPAMRPACQDGVLAANGQLYWGPWMCDCNHSLVGVISLQNAGSFEFERPATNAERLETLINIQEPMPAFPTGKNDWPTYRRDNQRTAAIDVRVDANSEELWKVDVKADPTAPIIANGTVFVGGSDGIVRSMNLDTGKTNWQAFTGGKIHYPPTLAAHQLFVGSADGWVYAYEAASGRLRWRFRGAPEHRKLPVYGSLSSTWPIASGVMVQDGIAYFGAGIVCHDGTHVYAVEAATGKLKWQNNQSGNLIGENEVVGVSVQGHMLFNNNQVYMAGGNVVSPAIYDASKGACLNKLEGKPENSLDDHWKMQRSSRGSELFLVNDQVIVADNMLYAPKDRGPASRYYAKYLVQATANDVVIQGTDQLMARTVVGADGKRKVVWKDTRFAVTSGVVLTANAVVIAGELKGDNDQTQAVVEALDIDSGKVLWSHKLTERAAKWGIAVSSNGRVVITTINGQVLCFGKRG